MRVIAVIDLMSGKVVHAVGGRRREYRQIASALCDNADPLSAARAFRRHFGLTELYLADLDAIAGATPAADIWTRLRDDGFQLWVDAGVHDLHDAQTVAAAGVGVVVGLETLAGPEALAEIVSVYAECVFSLDLREGNPLVRQVVTPPSHKPDAQARDAVDASLALQACEADNPLSDSLGHRGIWQHSDAQGIAAEAVALGVKRLLVLDLARVGTASGTCTEDLCASLAASYPRVEILAGGGVRGREDLLRLKSCGVSAVLAASALHDGRLTRADILTA